MLTLNAVTGLSLHRISLDTTTLRKEDVGNVRKG